MATLFEAYVTNAGKYSEGQLVGETLKFPTTAQEVEALLKRIGVDGVRYQEIFITSFDGDVLGLYDHLSEYENLDELNHLACLLSDLTRCVGKNNNVYYSCSTYKNRSRTACTMHSIKHERLEAAVLFAVQHQVHLAVSYSEIVTQINSAPIKKS